MYEAVITMRNGRVILVTGMMEECIKKIMEIGAGVKKVGIKAIGKGREEG